MPLSPRRTPPQIFEPWAANLLPEASQLRTVGRRLGAAPEDTIAILAEIGRDTAGALSIGKPGSVDPGGWVPVPNDAALERIINELPSKPFLVGEDGVSMSLAGVQTKLGVALNTEGQICIPHDGAPSTHILKPDSDGLFGGVQNEALCLVLAGRCGLNASRVTTGKVGERTYLLVTRYDRLEQAGRWRRLHQEDFCQALGKPPSAKYEANQSGIKGPTLIDMFALTRNAMRAPDVLHLLDYVLFNVLVCNTDAHAKNYSLMISGRGFSLAPTYDVMCAAAWEGITRNLAQKIAGKNRGEHLERRHWQAFAGDCGLNGPRLIKRVEELANAVSRQVKAAEAEVDAMPAGTHALMPAFVEAIEARARAILSGLSEDKPRRPTPSPTTLASPAKRSRTKKAKA
jgi:serine/threonine-protein kinase HipA